MAWNGRYTVSLGSALGSVLALLLCPGMAWGQEIEVSQTDAIPESKISPRFGVDFNSPRSGDDERSYGRVTGFIPLWQSTGNGLTFLDTAVRLNSTGELGGTVTVGQRFLQGGLVLGGHLSYDIRDTGNSTFNQLGLGVEAFGDKWDVHLNGYLPVGDTQKSTGSSGGASQITTDTQFQGNQLVFITTGGGSEFLESAWGGVDLDAGMQLADWANWGQLWGYGGVYYHGDAIGGRLRVDHRVQDWLRLGLGVQSDDNFGTQGFFSIGFSWGGNSSRDTTDESASLWARAAESVTRNSSIVVKESEVITAVASGTEVAVNPATGQAYSFQHVTPDSTSTSGDGSIENPAANVNLISAQAGDIVYVREGDSRTNPLAPFTVSAGVVVISDAIAETITTQAGEIALPGSGTGILPLVDATGSNAGITLTGGSNRLSGFEITGATDANVFVNSANSALVENNFIRDSLVDGIRLFNSSNVTLTNNTFSNSIDDAIELESSPSAVISNNIISGSSDGGIYILTSTTPIIRGNTISNSGDDGILLESSDNAVIQSNIITNAVESGIELLTSANATVEGNSTDGGEFGIFIDSSDSALVQTNQITNSTLVGIELSTATNASLIGNTISDSGSGGIFALNGDTITIQNNQVTDTATDITANSIAGAIFLQEVIGEVNINGNTVTGTTGTSIIDGQGIAFGNSTGNVTLTIDENTVSNNQGDGIGVALVDVGAGAGNATADIIITNNTVENNGLAVPVQGDGIKITLEENSEVNSLVIADNILTGNFDDGIDFSLGLAEALSLPVSDSNVQVFDAVISGNTITNSQNGPGIVLRSLGDNSNLGVLITSNELTGNASTGLEATSADTDGDNETQLCIVLNNNTSDNGYLLTETPGSVFSVVERDLVNGQNAGTVTFLPLQTAFDDITGTCPTLLF